MKLIFITGNASKLAEAKHILPEFDIENYPMDIPEIQGSRQEIVKNKAKKAAKMLNRTVIVDDTSLCFSALKGLPGPYIKEFEKIGLNDLVKLLSGFKDKTAQAVCSIGYCRPGKEPRVFEGIVHGRIVEPRGKGFGWDPIFEPDGQNKTYGEMTMEEKNGIQHRKISLLKLRDFLLQQNSKNTF